MLSPNVLLTKRRGSSYSVDASIRLRNRGIHWPVFEEKRGRCEVCSTKGIESRPHCKCFMCGVFLCCNAAKIALVNTITFFNINVINDMGGQL